MPRRKNLVGSLTPCAARVEHEQKLEDDEKVDLKIKAKEVVKIYAPLAYITPFEKHDEIIRSSINERWFAGRETTSAEQRVKFVNIAQHVFNNLLCQIQVADNQDEQNCRIPRETDQSRAKVKKNLYRQYAQVPRLKRMFDLCDCRNP